MTNAGDETTHIDPICQVERQGTAATTHSTASRLHRTQSRGAESLLTSLASLQDDLSSSDKWHTSRWRHTFGLALLLVTVFLWTTSNFLASTIFADNTYSKPYYVTYVNSSFFIIPLIPVLLHKWRKNPEELRQVVTELQEQKWRFLLSSTSSSRARVSRTAEEEEGLVPKPADEESLANIDAVQNTNNTLSQPPRRRISGIATSYEGGEKLSIRDTSVLALPFCFLWFFANYFSVACLEYTTVGSATILTSTSSIWTLICGTLVGVERFTLRKLVGVLASLAGVAIISSIDVSAGDDKDRGTFPHKTAREVAIGDILALISALVYGIYCVVIKKRIGDESRISMPLFFGLVGLLNILLMWPGFVVLHFLRIEEFEMPPTAWITGIIAINSTSSLVSDYCWAFAMLLTSPLLVTVGLSLTIPLSLVGQMLLSGTYTGWAYWLGAIVMVGSFVFINHEEKKEEDLDLLESSSAIFVVAEDEENAVDNDLP